MKKWLLEDKKNEASEILEGYEKPIHKKYTQLKHKYIVRKVSKMFYLGSKVEWQQTEINGFF